MEDVLDVYTRPYDPTRPLVCMDETSKQLIGEARPPLPDGAGAAGADRLRVRAARASPTCSWSPSRCAGWRWVSVTDRRTRGRLGRAAIEELVDVRYPEAERIVLVMDNLNTHTPASLYEAFPISPSRGATCAG